MSSLANRISQRAIRVEREQMRHAEIGVGGYLLAFLSPSSFEDIAVRFTRAIQLRPEIVRPIVERSQPSTVGVPAVIEHFTQPAKEMLEIAAIMANFRYRQAPYGPLLRISPEDLVVGVLQSGDPIVDELTKMQGIMPSVIYRQLDIKLAPGVIDRMVYR